jgi:muramoyltetrapeptide carboxypeptidase
MPTLNKTILFVEERGEALYRIDRMMTHLRLSGLLDQLEGLIMGRFTECGDISDINQLVMDIVSDMNMPIASGLPIGHGEQNVTLPIGLQTTLDTEQMILSIEDSYCK